MLDLKELERKLDAALSKETEKTLTQWLLSKRFKKFEFLGEGIFEELSTSFLIIQSKTCVPQNFYNTSDCFIDIEESKFCIAA